MAPVAAPPTTVVVVHRDRPKLLAATLDALAAQTVPVRVLLVDSGSTEDAHRAALELLPAGSDVVRMGRNGGFGARKSGGTGKRVSVRVDIGGRRNIKKQTH